MELENEGSRSSQPPANACMACRNGKRRCDRVLPSCTTCARVGRLCIYDDDPVCQPRSLDTSLLNFRQPMTDVHMHMRMEAFRIFGSLDEVNKLSTIYFESVHHRLPVISINRFHQHLPHLFTSSNADFVILCLCIGLILQSSDPMTSSLYNTVKTSISLLEANNYNSLDTIQSRLLIVFYEMGHGLYPATSISIGACARAARSLRLHQVDSKFVEPALVDITREEGRRTWWAVHNLDRFISLCCGDSIFVTEDADKEDPLPAVDEICSQSISSSDAVKTTIATAATFRVGQFARECQVSHLVGRVVQHVFNPVADYSFHADEAAQLERTLLSYLPMLIEEELKFSTYCGALAMCVSALFTLYSSPLLHSRDRNVYESHTLATVKDLSTRVAQISGHLLGIAQDDKNQMAFSPYIPYALYQIAATQLRLWQETNEASYKERADDMVKVLRYISKRWRIAGKYLIALTSPKPPFILPPHGFFMSMDDSPRTHPI
ncbi:hypothetical protein F5884DRAFT_780504 [Xylogone sp. PMI_703]|nr:hypothetical protein F5884DRAFT_780504 [Xylogone sp. PMI_703]